MASSSGEPPKASSRDGSPTRAQQLLVHITRQRAEKGRQGRQEIEQMRQLRAQLQEEHMEHGRKLAAEKRQQAHVTQLNVVAKEMERKAAGAAVKAQGKAVREQLGQQRSEWAGYGKALSQHHGRRAQAARIHESKSEYARYAQAVAEQGRALAAYSREGRKGDWETSRQTNWEKAEHVRRDQGRSRHVAQGSARGRRKGGTAGMSRGQMAKRAVHEQKIEKVSLRNAASPNKTPWCVPLAWLCWLAHWLHALSQK